MGVVELRKEDDKPLFNKLNELFKHDGVLEDDGELWKGYSGRGAIKCISFLSLHLDYH